METIKEFNSILNKSKENRFDKWEKYRLEVSNYILESSKKYIKKPNNILVIGAGNCDDLDLRKLLNITNNITLSDIDEKAMFSALTKYNISKDLIRLEAVEYTGLSSSILWENFIPSVMNSKNNNELNEIIKKIAIVINKNDFLTDYQNNFDLIIISPIYTQLIFQQLLTSLSILNDINFPLDKIEFIKEKFLGIMPDILSTFNNNIKKLLRKTGFAIVMSDIFEAENDSEVDLELDSKITDNLEIQKYHSDYNNKYGLGLGDFGLKNLEIYLNLVDYKWIKWPFSNEKNIYVKIGVFLNEDR